MIEERRLPLDSKSGLDVPGILALIHPWSVCRSRKPRPIARKACVDCAGNTDACASRIQNGIGISLSVINSAQLPVFPAHSPHTFRVFCRNFLDLCCQTVFNRRLIDASPSLRIGSGSLILRKLGASLPSRLGHRFPRSWS